MKLKLNLTQFFDLIENKFFYRDQAEILVNNFMTGENKQLPYVTKSQLKKLRIMGCVKI